MHSQREYLITFLTNKILVIYSSVKFSTAQCIHKWHAETYCRLETRVKAASNKQQSQYLICCNDLTLVPNSYTGIENI